MAPRKFVVPIDMLQLEIRQQVAHLLASAPGSPVEGQLYYDTVTKTFEFHNGTSFISLGRLDQIEAPTADVSLASHKLTNVTDPTNPQDAATRAYVLGLHVTDLTAPAADFAMNSHKITGVTDPTSAQDAATKAYVDAVAAGLNWKDSVRAATTAAGTLATSFENGDTVDGVVLATGNRILIKNQAAPAENGIYVVAASGAPTRAGDADTGGEILQAAVFVEEGTVNADTGWVCTTNGTITINSTSLAFAQFTGATVTAGAGLTATGSTIDAVAASAFGTGGPGGGLKVNADDIAVDSDVVVRKFSADVGDGASTSITVTHNLGTKDVIVQVYDKTTPFAQVECDVDHATTNTVTLIFAVAPGSAQYRAVVHG